MVEAQPVHLSALAPPPREALDDMIHPPVLHKGSTFGQTCHDVQLGPSLSELRYVRVCGYVVSGPAPPGTQDHSFIPWVSRKPARNLHLYPTYRSTFFMRASVQAIVI